MLWLGDIAPEAMPPGQTAGIVRGIAPIPESVACRRPTNPAGLRAVLRRRLLAREASGHAATTAATAGGRNDHTGDVEAILDSVQDDELHSRSSLRNRSDEARADAVARLTRGDPSSETVGRNGEAMELSNDGTKRCREGRKGTEPASRVSYYRQESGPQGTLLPGRRTLKSVRRCPVQPVRWCRNTASGRLVCLRTGDGPSGRGVARPSRKAAATVGRRRGHMRRNRCP